MEDPLDPLDVDEPLDPLDVDEPPDPLDVDDPLDPPDVEDPPDPLDVDDPLDPLDVEDPPVLLEVEVPPVLLEVEVPPVLLEVEEPPDPLEVDVPPVLLEVEEPPLVPPEEVDDPPVLELEAPPEEEVAAVSASLPASGVEPPSISVLTLVPVPPVKVGPSAPLSEPHPAAPTAISVAAKIHTVRLVFMKFRRGLAVAHMCVRGHQHRASRRRSITKQCEGDQLLPARMCSHSCTKPRPLRSGVT